MSICYDDALRNGIISKSTYDILPKECICGAKLVLDDAVRDIKCTNDKCKASLVNRAYSFSEKLNLGLSVSDVILIIDSLKIISPYQLMLLPSAYKSGVITSDFIINIDDIVSNIKKISNRSFYLYEIIELCGYESISNVARTLAFGFNSVDEFYDEVGRGQLSFINERLGIESADACVLSHLIYDELMELRDELIFAETMFNVKQYSNRIFVAFNDLAGDFLNKSEFMQYINYRFKKNTFVHVESITDRLDILIKNSHLTSTKFKVARLLNDKYVAEAVNSGKMQLSEIGNKVANELKPLGYIIYVDTVENVLNRLRELEI